MRPREFCFFSEEIDTNMTLGLICTEVVTIGHVLLYLLYVVNETGPYRTINNISVLYQSCINFVSNA